MEEKRGTIRAMRSPWRVLAIVGLCACKPTDEVKTARLALHALPSCELPAALADATKRLRATGDFKARESNAAVGAPFDVPPSTEWLGLDLTPAGTRTAVAGGLAAVRFADAVRAMLVLPLDVHRSCPLGDN